MCEADADAKRLVSRYFEMWNTGDSSVVAEVLSEDWVDHAHPDMGGPDGVRQAVEAVRAAQPDLHFRIDALLANGDLIAVIGAALRQGDGEAHPSRLVWLIRTAKGRMAEMRTYHESGASSA
jgi:ketosteroid isomerase-like protein